MYCEVCGRTGGHLHGCPESNSKYYAAHRCDVCGNPILNGEEYIVNDSGDYGHYDCFISFSDLLKWLGIEVKTMEEEE